MDESAVTVTCVGGWHARSIKNCIYTGETVMAYREADVGIRPVPSSSRLDVRHHGFANSARVDTPAAEQGDAAAPE